MATTDRSDRAERSDSPRQPRPRARAKASVNVRLWKDDVQFIRDVARTTGEPYVAVLRRYVSEAVARAKAAGSGRIA